MVKNIPRFVVAALATIPVAAFFAVEVLIVILAGLDEHSAPVSQVRIVVFAASWVVLIYWAMMGTASVRRTVSRTCWAFSTAALLLPIMMIVLGVTTPPAPADTIFPESLILAVISFFGVILGAVGLLLAVVIASGGSRAVCGATISGNQRGCPSHRRDTHCAGAHAAGSRSWRTARGERSRPLE